MTNVTVIIAAWNAAATLPKAVRSCLAQESVNVEVIIVDDASSDNTTEVANALAAKDSRVSLIRQSVNGGPSAARNVGLGAAQGQWIAVLDADDEMEPNRLSKMTGFGKDQTADVVYDNLALIDVNDPDASQDVLLPTAEFGRVAQWDLEFFLRHNQAEVGQPSLGYLKPVFRREFADKHGIRYQEQLRNGEDFHLMLEMLRCGADLWYLPKPLYRYTTGAESISSKLNLDHARHLIAATHDFIANYGSEVSAEAKSLMVRRGQRLSNFANAEKAMRALKSRRIGEAIRTIWKQPQSLFRFTQQLGQALSNRL